MNWDVENKASSDLPQDFARPPASAFIREEVNIPLTPELIGQLRSLGIKPVLSQLLAAATGLLFRYSAQDQIPIAFLSTGSEDSCVKNVCFQLQISNRDSGESLLEQVEHRINSTSYESQLIASAGVILLGPPEGISNEQLDNSRHWIVDRDVVWILETDLQTATLCCNFNAEIFTLLTGQYMAQQLLLLLTGILTHPTTPIVLLPLITTEQHQQLPEDNGRASSDSCPEDFLPHLFERQVALYPDSCAVSDGYQKLTYRELNQRANKMAHYLHLQGIGEGDILALIMGRSADLLVALLAIVKAGAGYLPLDPNYPSERINYTLRDAGITGLLAEKSSQEMFSDGDIPLIKVDERILEQQPDSSPETVYSTHQLAYIIYTSGSTGQPKGIQISHGALSNLLQSMAVQPGMSPGDVLVAVTTIAFDIAALELFLPITTGSQVVIADLHQSNDGYRLARVLEDNQATCMQATPITWELLLRAGWTPPAGFKCLSGGEALTVTLASRLLTNSSVLWNLYGPSETTIWSSLHNVTYADLDVPGGIIPIGQPINNTQFYVLDEHQKLLPIGVPGELYIGGAGLAESYHNQAQLSADKFIHWQFPDASSVRLFRTGDRVRRLPDGSLLFRGRLDNQIKLRGYRIELGEIESVLQQHPSVAQAATRIEPFEGDPGLAAYIVFNGQSGNPQELRRYLAKILPAYMLPTRYHRLKQMPLTLNGKIDRRSLPTAMIEAYSEVNIATNSLDCSTQQFITDIWAELFGTREFGISDNFFDLGGHSLLLIQAYELLVERYSDKLSLLDLYRYPTIEALSQWLNEQESSPVMNEAGSVRGSKRRSRLMRKPTITSTDTP